MVRCSQLLRGISPISPICSPIIADRSDGTVILFRAIKNSIATPQSAMSVPVTPRAVGRSPKRETSWGNQQHRRQCHNRGGDADACILHRHQREPDTQKRPDQRSAHDGIQCAAIAEFDDGRPNVASQCGIAYSTMPPIKMRICVADSAE